MLSLSIIPFLCLIHITICQLCIFCRVGAITLFGKIESG